MNADVVDSPQAGADSVPVIICGGFFFAIDLLLTSRAWFFEHEQLLIALSVPLSQCSLAAVWASNSRTNVAVRFAVPLVGIVFSWYVLTQLLPWGIGEPASAAWALALAIQALLIVISISLYQRVRELSKRTQEDDQRQNEQLVRSPFTFELRTLMLWTTVFALAGGFVQYARTQWQWTSGIADWEFLKAMPVLAAMNTAVAVAWLWAITSGSWRTRCAKILVACILVGTLSWTLPRLIGWLSTATAIEARELLVLGAAQSVWIAGSLAFVLLGMWHQRSRTAPQMRPKAASK